MPIFRVLCHESSPDQIGFLAPSAVYTGGASGSTLRPSIVPWLSRCHRCRPSGRTTALSGGCSFSARSAMGGCKCTSRPDARCNSSTCRPARTTGSGVAFCITGTFSHTPSATRPRAPNRLTETEVVRRRVATSPGVALEQCRSTGRSDVRAVHNPALVPRGGTPAISHSP